MTLQDATERMTLREEDLPALYQAANESSLKAQRQFLRRTGGGLVMVVIAAAAGAFTWRVTEFGTADLAGIVAAVAFSVAILLRLYLLTDRPESTWYEGRAAAESAKTLAWSYAVGAEPFCMAQTSKAADAAFVASLNQILENLDSVNLTAPSGSKAQITEGMRELRSSSLKKRKDAYRIGRIEDQRDWYTRKARWNEVRADRWTVALVFLEVLGLAAAILKATGLMEIDLLGLAAAMVAVGASWLQTKQHSILSKAYSLTAQELTGISDLIPSYKTEAMWANFVSEAEDAISREHKRWLAPRTTK